MEEGVLISPCFHLIKLISISDRTKKDSDCPFCANVMNVSEHKMLEYIKEIFEGEEVRYCYRPN